MATEAKVAQMRRSAGTLLVGIELGIFGWWALNLSYPTGFDPLGYQRMADAIVRYGLAPWVISPLSYVGMYPASDSSGVPFLAASVTLASGISPTAATLVYDGALMLISGLSLFLLTRRLTNRVDASLVAVLMGSLAYGFSTSILWSLDERSFNVALAPLFLALIIPWHPQMAPRSRAKDYVVLALVSFIMFVSHENFLLLVPFLVLLPLIYRALRQMRVARRNRRASLAYFGAIALSPLLFISVLNQFGILSDFGLEYNLESSALLSGNSPIIFVANSLIFLGVRVGPVSFLIGLLGLLYLASRPMLLPRNIVAGAFLLVGFIGLPIVLYSKDLLIPIIVLLAGIGLGSLFARLKTWRTGAVVVAVIVVISGSLAFDTWNSARTSNTADTLYWALPGMTPEAQSGGLWITAKEPAATCSYGNNLAMLQQVATGSGASVCSSLSVDYMISLGAAALSRPPPFHVVFAGVAGLNPSNWFVSPDLNSASEEFNNLPFMSYDAGRALLLRYNVTLIVVDMQKPFEVPSYGYGTSYASAFFTELWARTYPLYRSEDFAIFALNK